MNSLKSVLLLALVASLLVAASAHKKFYGPGPQQYGGGSPECICDCGRPQQPILPNKPYYGSGGYHQPRPSSGGYGGSGSYAVSGSYGSGGGQTSGGY